MRQIKILGYVLLLAALALGCADSQTPADESSLAADTASSAETTDAADAGGESEPEPGGTEITLPGAVFTLPATWAPEQPASQMRLAQARIPGSGGAGVLAVFYFPPGSGGGVDANLDRWENQVEATSDPVRDSFVLGDWTVTWTDTPGTLKPAMGGPTEPQPDSRLYGAVVEGTGGLWVFKATGPAGTLEAEREAYLDLLKSGRPTP